MKAASAAWQKAIAIIGVWMALLSAPVWAQAAAQLATLHEDGFARLVLNFPGRLDLPAYAMKHENGVVAVTFDEPISLMVPDVALVLPDHVSVARLDPDGRALRLGLRNAFNVNRIEAGERLFIDILPLDWQGLPPGLPQDVVDELAERARLAAIEAERRRKAEGAASLEPAVDVRLGRNPTFLRLQFDWSVDTDANFVQSGTLGALAFEWPVYIDLTQLQVDLPAEILSIESENTVDGAVVSFEFAENVTPRFYTTSARQAFLDFDLSGVTLPVISSEDLAAQAAPAVEETEPVAQPDPLRVEAEHPITPFINRLGETVRIVFPFEQEVPAAVFRRANTVWMLFDTAALVRAPDEAGDLDGIASRFSSLPSGDTQVVRIDLAEDRLATLGSEGRAWVLSLGDVLLAPTQPLELARRRDSSGQLEIAVDLERPARVHSFADPIVGDVLEVVTSYPPARGVTRVLDYVDFTALRSVHGLVVRPKHEGVEVEIDNRFARIHGTAGLILSDEAAQLGAAGQSSTERLGFIDFRSLTAPNAGAFRVRAEELLTAAAAAEGSARDEARLALARYYIANQHAHEALGLIEVLKEELSADGLLPRIRALEGIANTLAYRPQAAIAVLSPLPLAGDRDAVFWRAIARLENGDYSAARQDVLLAEPVLDSYPSWVRARFLLAGVRAAVEMDDPGMATRLIERIAYRDLTIQDMSLYHLLVGRLEELAGRDQDAMDSYGQVIAMDVRPTRAEAIYRTMRLLDAEGRLDVGRAAQTLAAEATLWRGDSLELQMIEMLVELYFRDGQYRPGFEAVRQATQGQRSGLALNRLVDGAQTSFSDLFLNGHADALEPIEALALYYDFRHLTPPGSRGDEMIRNLARRLVAVDLLPQAADLLDYQIEHRLSGMARSQVGTDLALIRLADRRPDLALRVLNDTRLANLSAPLQRQRDILEVRALIDAGRQELALDMLSRMSGRDVDLLRIAAHWKGRRYALAAEHIEALYPGATPSELNAADRANIIRAAAGYVLGNDSLGRARLREKFGDVMVTTPDWPIFDLVTSDISPTSLEFTAIAREIAGINEINGFLAAYRDSYGHSGAIVPVNAAGPAGPVASAPPALPAS